MTKVDWLRCNLSTTGRQEQGVTDVTRVPCSRERCHGSADAASTSFFSGLPFHKAVAVVLSLPLSHVETGKLGTKGNGEKRWVMARKKLKGVEFPGRITSLRWTVLMPGQLF